MLVFYLPVFPMFKKLSEWKILISHTSDEVDKRSIGKKITSRSQHDWSVFEKDKIKE